VQQWAGEGALGGFLPQHRILTSVSNWRHSASVWVTSNFSPAAAVDGAYHDRTVMAANAVAPMATNSRLFMLATSPRMTVQRAARPFAPAGRPVANGNGVNAPFASIRKLPDGMRPAIQIVEISAAGDRHVDGRAAPPVTPVRPS
jgi:hypothetical protein